MITIAKTSLIVYELQLESYLQEIHNLNDSSFSLAIMKNQYVLEIINKRKTIGTN